ncbi:hypothetical protein C8Q78DRAFT_476325 [Trametes maxima]|nr:hypothetical protein C8Q78DRAFT_476325 [Trametes maxima]
MAMLPTPPHLPVSRAKIRDGLPGRCCCGCRCQGGRQPQMPPGSSFVDPSLRTPPARDLASRRDLRERQLNGCFVPVRRAAANAPWRASSPLPSPSPSTPDWIEGGGLAVDGNWEFLARVRATSRPAGVRPRAGTVLCAEPEPKPEPEQQVFFSILCTPPHAGFYWSPPACPSPDFISGLPSFQRRAFVGLPRTVAGQASGLRGGFPGLSSVQPP